MPNPFKVACHCGFAADDPQAFIDHALTTGHVDLPVGADNGALLELAEMIAFIQRASAAQAAGEPVELPEGAELRQVSEADIMADDDLSDEEKADILKQLHVIEQRHKGE